MLCTTCTSELETDAAYCGVCGERVRGRRDSLTGALLDGRFRIVGKLAAGGFGAIYRATHAESGAVVALKVLHADLACDPNLNARFRREAAALAQLRDAHTLTTYELAEAPDGTLFIVMELLHGTSLLARFRQHGPIPWRRMVAIARQVCSSLAEAHGLGIVHRDLKPANIHLEHRAGNPDFVKVLDFGIAKMLDASGLDAGGDLTRVGQAIGTLEYMAPEQIVGGACDGRCDLYTLGVVMYEMITGRRPFADASGPTSLLTALMTRSPVPLAALIATLPPELDRVLMRCLEREPEQRYAHVGELAAALDQLIARYPEAPTDALISTLPGAGPQPWSGMADGDEVTTVDEVAHVLDPIWEPLPAIVPPSRTPSLVIPPDPPFDELAVGSTVGAVPAMAQRPIVPPPKVGLAIVPRRLGVVRVVVWAAGLLGIGIAAGIGVASLI